MGALKTAERRAASLVILELDTQEDWQHAGHRPCHHALARSRGGLRRGRARRLRGLLHHPVSGRRRGGAGTRFGAAWSDSGARDGREGRSRPEEGGERPPPDPHLLAQNRRRNVSLAEEAVRESRSFTEKEALKEG